MIKKFIFDNLKTLFYALIIAIFIRSLLIQPFYIQSSSMEPNLLVGDRLFVTKFTYGYSKHSFPFSPPLFNDRLLNKKPLSRPARPDTLSSFRPAPSGRQRPSGIQYPSGMQCPSGRHSRATALYTILRQRGCPIHYPQADLPPKDY